MKVPSSYKRIHKVTRYPTYIQEPLVQYQEVIEEDSSYEDDDAVLQKYVSDPVAYIKG